MKGALLWLKGQTGKQWDKVGFLLSGSISTIIDNALYIMLLMITKSLDPNAGVTISFIAARIISSIANFHINKHFVFRSKKGTTESAIKYFALVIGVMMTSTLLLNIVAEFTEINLVVAKMLIDFCFFIINWAVQKYVIFK